MRKRDVPKNVQQLADDIVADATGAAHGDSCQARGKKRKRRMTPEGAEDHEIVPAEVKMSDLVKDRLLGKRSQREAEMEKIDWAEIKKKRREAEKEGMEEERRRKESRKNGPDLPAPGFHATERLVLVNGQMVIDESSRVIDRSAATVRDAEQSGEAINEDRLTARVNQATVGRKAGTRTYSTWDDEETEQFYQGLRMFGTDFMMISKMFPDTTRAMVKRKFNKEERHHPQKVLMALSSKDPVDLQVFSAITNTTYDDPKEFYKELDAEQARLEAEDAAMRAEGVPADQEIQESIEQAEEGGAPEREHQGPGQQESNNKFAEEARSIVDGTTTSRRKKTSSSKKTPSAKKKDGKRSRGPPAEGTEEIVGTIEDFDP